MKVEEHNTDVKENESNTENTALAVDEVADILKSKDNLRYLFELSGLVTRLFFTSKKDDYDIFFQRSVERN